MYKAEGEHSGTNLQVEHMVVETKKKKLKTDFDRYE